MLFKFPNNVNKLAYIYSAFPYYPVNKLSHACDYRKLFTRLKLYLPFIIHLQMTASAFSIKYNKSTLIIIGVDFFL